MALQPLQAQSPIGQYDGYDAETTLGASALLGGEVVTLVGIALGSTDKAAKDADGSDGYVGTTNKQRVVVTKNLPDGNRPVFLADEGSKGYGQLFGEVIGGAAGQKVTGTRIGPHSAEGSGKVTVWGMPGLYSVTLDAVDTLADGLVPTNGALTVGESLTATSAGLLTPLASGRSFDTSDYVVGRFVEFATDGSLVTTPSYLTDSSVQNRFTKAIVWFGPGQ
jgi:hypothetical protein